MTVQELESLPEHKDPRIKVIQTNIDIQPFRDHTGRKWVPVLTDAGWMKEISIFK